MGGAIFYSSRKFAHQCAETASMVSKLSDIQQDLNAISSSMERIHLINGTSRTRLDQIKIEPRHHL
jgi:hypothetical protein